VKLFAGSVRPRSIGIGVGVIVALETLLGGTGGNLINVANNLAPTGYLNGVSVFSSLGGTTGFTITQPAPLLGLNSLGTIRINGTPLPSNATTGMTGSLMAIQGNGSVRIGP